MRWPPREDDGGGRRTRGERAGVGGGGWWRCSLQVWAGGGAVMGENGDRGVGWARLTSRTRRRPGGAFGSVEYKIEGPAIGNDSVSQTCWSM
jgi:hypothetical protein